MRRGIALWVLGAAFWTPAGLAQESHSHPPPEKLGQENARVCNTEVHALDGMHQRLFDADGNRQSHTGEHIVWVKPTFFEDRVDLTSKISVWRLLDSECWQLVEAFGAKYNQSRQEGAP